MHKLHKKGILYANIKKLSITHEKYIYTMKRCAYKMRI